VALETPIVCSGGYRPLPSTRASVIPDWPSAAPSHTKIQQPLLTSRSGLQHGRCVYYALGWLLSTHPDTSRCQ